MLFFQAILESDPFAFEYKDSKDAKYWGNLFSKAMNCSDSVECLRNLVRFPLNIVW